MPATFRCMMGIEQIWLMIELMMRIDQSKRMLENTAAEEATISSFAITKKRWVTIGRYAVHILNVGQLVVMIFLCRQIVKDAVPNCDMFWNIGYMFEVQFTALFCLLIGVVLALISKLRANARALITDFDQDSSDYFR